jgi:two-component system chemotaxis response regulator CheB
VVAALPATLAAPVAIVLHIPVGYTEALAARLDRAASLHVVEAVDGMPLERGLVVLARGGTNLHLERSGPGVRVRLRPEPKSTYIPSVDELFTSGAACTGRATLGVVLTGMGDDGLIGARAIAAAGGALITEAPATCVVYGMPRAVFEAGLGAASVPLDGIAEEIARRA